MNVWLIAPTGWPLAKVAPIAALPPGTIPLTLLIARLPDVVVPKVMRLTREPEALAQLAELVPAIDPA